MKPVPYLLVQDRLPAGGSLSRRDAVADGLLIRYASQGLVDLFGHSAAELAGKTWLDLACGADILEHGPTCRYLTRASGLTAGEAADGLRRLAGDAEASIAGMVENPEEQAAFVHLLARRKGGRLFVCESVMFMHEHPAFGWKFCVAFHRDVTGSIPVGRLLGAALRREHRALCRTREADMKMRMSSMGVGQLMVDEYLNEKATEMWTCLVANLTQSVLCLAHVGSDSLLTS